MNLIIKRRWSGGLKRKRRLMAEKGDRCWKCGCVLHAVWSERRDGSKKAHIHHVIHRSQDGGDQDSNLVLTCISCERKTHNEGGLICEN